MGLQSPGVQYAVDRSDGSFFISTRDSGTPSATWFVYILECRDGSLYTGIAIDVTRRYAVHAAGKGARYTRAHPPARVLATFAHPDRGAASKAEYAIKQLSAAAKRALCAGQSAMSDG